MGILGYIERLRHRPERERMTVAVIASASITGLIALVWLTAVIARAPAPQHAVEATSPSFSQQLETLGAGVTGAYETIQSGLEEFQSAIGSEATPEGSASTEDGSARARDESGVDLGSEFFVDTRPF